jgi:hypothetical protein
MNNLDHISESLEIIFFWLEYLNSLMRIRYPGWKKFATQEKAEDKTDVEQDTGKQDNSAQDGR